MAIAVSGVMKPDVHTLDGDQMAFRADHGDRNRHPHDIGLLNHRFDKFAAFDRPQFRHLPKIPFGLPAAY
ncbi:MAG: hypothetical protein ABI830_04525 [Pseudolabrys sp.]